MNQIRYDGPVTIAVGESRRSTQWKNKEVLWSQLVERLSIPTKTPETVDEYRGFAKSKRDEIKDVGGFVGGSLKGGRRKAEAIMQRRLLTLDLDDVPRNADPWDTVVLVLGCAAVLYSTHSHRPEAPRLRLVMPLSRPVSPEEYSAIARKVAQDIGIDMCDDTTYEPHRLMYWPSASINAEYRYEVEDGPWLNADEQLARYVDWHDPSEFLRIWPNASRSMTTTFLRSSINTSVFGRWGCLRPKSSSSLPLSQERPRLSSKSSWHKPLTRRLPLTQKSMRLQAWVTLTLSQLPAFARRCKAVFGKQAESSAT